MCSSRRATKGACTVERTRTTAVIARLERTDGRRDAAIVAEERAGRRDSRGRCNLRNGGVKVCAFGSDAAALRQLLYNDNADVGSSGRAPSAVDWLKQF